MGIAESEIVRAIGLRIRVNRIEKHYKVINTYMLHIELLPFTHGAGEKNETPKLCDQVTRKSG